MLGEKEPDHWNKLVRIIQFVARIPLMLLAVAVSSLAAWLLLIFAWRLAVMLYERFLSKPLDWGW